MKSMHAISNLRVSALLWALALAPALQGGQSLLTFVFGPSSQETARQAARSAASTAHRWLTKGDDVEIRRAGSPDAQRLAPGAGFKDVEQAFTDAALAARDADPVSFLISLDAAAQASALHSGTRILVAVVNTPPLSSDEERTLQRLVEVCRTGAVRVLVMDIAEGVKTDSNKALAALATRTGGMWLGQAKALESSVNVVAAATGAPAAAPAPVPAEPSVAAAQAAPPRPGAIPKFEIPVHVRFIRTSGKGYISSGVANQFGTGIDNAELSDQAYQANESVQPMQGFLTVESPLNALKFDTDDNSGTYQAKARLTVNVRNGKGAVVWSARKDVNIHGPSRKLDVRRQGSFYFMRGVTLAGRGPFMMEAKVEDLLGGTTGVIRTPVQTSQNAPGLVASDALAVRAFKGAADRFEADQVFSYEGEALAPVLDPVYRAEEPINLRLYMVLYPDTHSATPELSIEIRRDGRVVARMPLQFKSPMANTSMEGKFGTMQGYGVAGAAIAGGQAKEFPYLADMKGAKFSPGNYEGIISIRQGKNVITRTVTFRVEGKLPAGVEEARSATAADAAEEAEDAAVVLPEIEPAAVDSSGLKMRPEEQKRLWDEAARSALGYLSHLPNFRCTQETHRFTAPIKSPDQLKEADSFKDDLMYENGRENYQTIEVNGVKVENASLSNTKGIHSRNEFGSLLRGLFEPEAGASYKWSGRAMAMGVLCEVFDVEVSRARTNFVLHYGGKRQPVGYTGRVFIEEETGMVRRLTIQGVGLPKDFGLQSPAFSLDYGMVRIGTQDYLLPLRSVLQLRHTKSFVRNETVFRSYRKFEAESDIKFENN